MRSPLGDLTLFLFREKFLCPDHVLGPYRSINAGAVRPPPRIPPGNPVLLVKLGVFCLVMVGERPSLSQITLEEVIHELLKTRRKPWRLRRLDDPILVREKIRRRDFDLEDRWPAALNIGGMQGICPCEEIVFGDVRAPQGYIRFREGPDDLRRPSGKYPVQARSARAVVGPHFSPISCAVPTRGLGVSKGGSLRVSRGGPFSVCMHIRDRAASKAGTSQDNPSCP